MMTAEVGYELRDVTSYLIGSPSEIPGYGAPYDVIIPQLFKNGRELYRGIIEHVYSAKHRILQRRRLSIQQDSQQLRLEPNHRLEPLRLELKCKVHQIIKASPWGKPFPFVKLVVAN